jgi:hypothetical protein
MGGRVKCNGISVREFIRNPSKQSLMRHITITDMIYKLIFM